MPDMNAELYRCCGFSVEISGYSVDLPEGGTGHRVHCEKCGTSFLVPGDLEAARHAIPEHFQSKHRLTGQLEAWEP